MANKLNKNRLGLVLGILFALMHAAWAMLIALGVGKPLIDLVLFLHFINVLFQTTGFTFVNAIFLIVLTFVSGYILGWVFAALWNLLSRTK